MAKRSFTPEYRREAVRHARKSGVALTQAAKDLGVHVNVLRGWCKKFDTGAWQEAAGSDLRSVQARELERVKRELAKVTMERDILKKALAYFAKETK
jgi:transposase